MRDSIQAPPGAPKPRILVCAPSNAATDELLERLLREGFRDFGAGRSERTGLKHTYCSIALESIRGLRGWITRKILHTLWEYGSDYAAWEYILHIYKTSLPIAYPMICTIQIAI